MTKGQLRETYTPKSAEDQRTFDHWLKASIVVGSIFAAALAVMAVAASNAGKPNQAAASGNENTASSAAQETVEHSPALSVYELMIRIAPDQLPVQQVDEPF